MNHDQKESTNCCPVFDPEPWDGKTWTWEEKLFLKDSMRTFFHIPSPKTLTKTLERMWTTVKDAGADPDQKEVIIMANDPTAFRSDYYINLTKDIPGANVVKLSGTYFTRVFDGPYNQAPKWIQLLKAEATEKGIRFVDFYFYYTTCPKCAKAYGHNYVVVFAKIG